MSHGCFYLAFVCSPPVLGLFIVLDAHAQLTQMYLHNALRLTNGISMFSKFQLRFGVLGSLLLICQCHYWNYLADNMSDIILTSTLTCPECGFKSKDEMPTNACMWFYYCKQCDVRLSPKEGDCCVYCSYGDVACPPIQAGDDCCSSWIN